MDISIVGNNSIRLKGKQVAFVVDPASDMSKVSADAIVLLNGYGNIDVSRVTDSRIIIDGPGGFEVSGAKVSGTGSFKGVIYKFLIDDVSVVVGRIAESKIEGSSDCQVAVINTDMEFNESFVTGLEPKIAVLYGPGKEESAKKLGAESVVLVPKITITKDKLPEKMEVVVLG